MSDSTYLHSLLALSPGDDHGTLDVRRGLERAQDGILLYVAMRIEEQPDVVEAKEEFVGEHCYAAFLLTEELLKKFGVATRVMVEHGFDRVEFAWEPVELDEVVGRIPDMVWNLKVCEDIVSIHGVRVDGGYCSVSSCNFVSIPTVAAALCTDCVGPLPFGVGLQWSAGSLLKNDAGTMTPKEFEDLLMTRSSAFAARAREHMMRDVIARYPSPSERPVQARMRRTGI